MRLRWRDKPIRTSAEWLANISAKDDQPGRSAPTLAAAWSGPLDVFAALDGEPAFEKLQIDRLTVEAQTRFDQFGGPRNADLLIEGTAAGGRVLISVEAKAGEAFGQTVGEYRSAATRKRDSGEPTDALERLDGLLARFGLSDNLNRDELRYQLLSAMAGTVEEARATEVDHAVLLVHDFITDERLPSGSADLSAFGRAVFNVDLPPDGELPWCIRLEQPSVPGPARLFELYLARAVTDLRPRSERT